MQIGKNSQSIIFKPSAYLFKSYIIQRKMILAIARFHKQINSWAPDGSGYNDLRSIQALVEDEDTWRLFKENSKKYPFCEKKETRHIIFEFDFERY